MNQQFRCGENDTFFKTLKTLARFSPRRDVYVYMYIFVCVPRVLRKKSGKHMVTQG